MALRLCGVCGTSGAPGIRPLFACGGKGCELSVHRECYGIPDDHPEQRKWYCKRCEPFSTIRSTKVKCFACPQKAGALKLVQHETFCHVVCALWLESVQVSSLTSLSGIAVGTDPNKASGTAGSTAMQCYICHSKNKGKEIANFGRMRKCHQKGCDRYMHITCAQEEQQLVIPFNEGKLDLRDKNRFVVACKLHPTTAGDSKLLGGNSEDGRSTSTPSELPGIVAPDGTVIRIGDGIKAYWKGGRDLYEGTISGIDASGETCSINYHDGDFESGVPRDRIRPMLMVRQAKQMATKTMAKQAKVAKKGTGIAASPHGTFTKSPSSVSTPSRPPTSSNETSNASTTEKGKASQSRNSDDAVGGAAARRRPSSETSPNNGKRAATVKSPTSVHSGSTADDSHSGATRARRAGASTDPTYTPVADKFAAALKQFARDDLQAVTKYLLRGSASHDATLLNKLDKAVSNRERLEKRLDDTNAEQTELEVKMYRLEHGTPDYTADIRVPHRAVLATSAQRASALQASVFAILGIETDVRCVLDANERTTLCNEIAAMSECIDTAIQGRDHRIAFTAGKIPSERPRSTSSCSDGSAAQPHVNSSRERSPVGVPLSKEGSEQCVVKSSGGAAHELQADPKVSSSRSQGEKHKAPAEAIEPGNSSVHAGEGLESKKPRMS